VGVALVETIWLADSGTTCTPSTIEEVAAIPESGVVEEGADASLPEEATEVFESAEGTLEAETELKLEDATCAAGEPVAREPGAELAKAVVVARTELPVVLASAGMSITSGSVATKTKATFWAPCMLPSDLSGVAIWEESAVRTEKLLVDARSVFDAESE
jgi:hypothetical protein